MSSRSSKSPRSSSAARASPHTRRHGGDASIRRGAALIRDQISRQFNIDKPATRSRPTTERQQPPPRSIEDDHDDNFTAFSDVWRSCGGPPSPPRLAVERAVSESLEYSLDDSMLDEIETFASKGDASQWARGSTLVSPCPSSRGSTPTVQGDSPTSTSGEDTPTTQMGRGRALTMKVKTHYFENHHQKENYDFIEDDYIDEFELDDYDEVCHPVYSRKDVLPLKPALKRHQTPPTDVAQKTASAAPSRQPPDAPKKQRSRTKAAPPEKMTILSKAGPTTDDANSHTSPRSAVLFDEYRQGPPSSSQDNSFSSSDTAEKNQFVDIPSPLHVDYELLLQDPAYLHAQRAGQVWQSLVGHHIRFPSRWWNGARAPPLGLEKDVPWQYLGRFACDDKRLRRFVKNRASPGRLLLHIVMLDLVTCKPLQDICVGCFHPSARGVRTTEEADPNWEGVRDLWLAVRKRTSGVSVMDTHLHIGEEPSGPTKSPLGGKHRVTNHNVRAVFGESPPVETLFVPESYLYELYMAALQKNNHAAAPPLLLLQEFVFA